MSVVQELLAAIEADPRDEASQMVIADHLQAEGDPRGDLIVLDHAERRGLLTDPAAIEQLLLLAAEYSFPRVEPDAPPLWEEIEPNRYLARHAGTRYDLWLGAYGMWELALSPPNDEGFEVSLAEVTTFDVRHLEVLGDVIRAGTPFDGMRLALDGIHVPQYDGGPLRCYQLPLEFLIPRGFMRNRFGLAARDYHRWHAIWGRLDAMQPAEDEL